MSYTANCTICNASFTKSTQTSADQALRLHTIRKHQTIPRGLRDAPKRITVRWTTDEIETLAIRAAQKRLADHDASLLDCARAAVKTLEPGRQRTIVSWSTFPAGFREKILVKIDSLKAAAIPPPKEIIQTVHIEVPKPVDPHTLASQAPTALLLTELFTRLITRLDKLESALVKPSPTTNSNGNGTHLDPIGTGFAPVPIPVARAVTSGLEKRLPRIAIAGLRRDQFEHAKTKLKETQAEYLFIDKEQVAAVVPRCDAVIIERHVQHRLGDKARAAVGHSRVFYADGISSVIQRAYDFLSRRPAIA